jgi:hypothetical protein
MLYTEFHENMSKKTKHTNFVTKVYLKTNYHTAILVKIQLLKVLYYQVYQNQSNQERQS